MIHFLQMGGFAVYVWPAVALAFIVMMLNIGWARRSLRSAQIDARRRLLAARPTMGPSGLQGVPQQPGPRQ